jgi:tetratricopeptide (TPR) repeat protein
VNRFVRTLRRAFEIVMVTATTAMAAPAGDFSAQLDALWDYGAPKISEARFRAELAKARPQSREALEASTQLARALGLQRRFADADAVLDRVQAALDGHPSRVRVRYLLERGRVRNSSGMPERAVPLFEEALEASTLDTLPGADFYRVDTLHMLGIAAPPAARLDWDLKALAAADASKDERTRGWRASLLNNIGWTYHDRANYAIALDYWQKALAAREASGDAASIRIAKWMVARGLRSLRRLDEAEAIQLALVRETEAANASDGYVYEELAEIALARNDAVAAKPWAAKAYAQLKNDDALKSGEPNRLARLARIAGVSP